MGTDRQRDGKDGTGAEGDVSFRPSVAPDPAIRIAGRGTVENDHFTPIAVGINFVGRGSRSHG